MSNLVKINNSKVDVSDLFAPSLNKKQKEKDNEEILEHFRKKYLKPVEKKKNKSISESSETSKKMNKKQMIDVFDRIDKSAENSQDSHKRQLQIAKILKYQESKFFNPLLKKSMKLSHTHETLSKKNNEQLEAVLNRMRVCLDQQTVHSFYNNLAEQGTVMTEKLLQNVYNIDGFAEDIKNNEHFWITFERFKIESDLPTIPIGFQLAQVLFTTAVVQHERNKKNNHKYQEEVATLLTSVEKEILDDEEEKKHDGNKKNGKGRKSIRLKKRPQTL